MIQNPEKYLITAGGRIYCQRCKAQSSRTKLQCAKPALKGKAVCGHHGGLSTGPRTQEGKDCIRAAHFRHGKETLGAKAARSAKSAMFLYLRDLGEHLQIFEPKKIGGRRPSSYKRQDLSNGINVLEIILRIENLSKS